MTLAPAEVGVDGFVAGLRRCGTNARLDGDLVVFEVVPPVGAYAGEAVETGVAVGELGAWPSVPPHWVHLPNTVIIQPTNTQASPRAGWLAHSRNIQNWGDATEPAQAWLAHVRSLLAQAHRPGS